MAIKKDKRNWSTVRHWDGSDSVATSENNPHPVNSTELNDRVGEVSATPTENTVQWRLDQISIAANEALRSRSERIINEQPEDDEIVLHDVVDKFMFKALGNEFASTADPVWDIAKYTYEDDQRFQIETIEFKFNASWDDCIAENTPPVIQEGNVIFIDSMTDTDNRRFDGGFDTSGRHEPDFPAAASYYHTSSNDFWQAKIFNNRLHSLRDSGFSTGHGEPSGITFPDKIRIRVFGRIDYSTTLGSNGGWAIGVDTKVMNTTTSYWKHINIRAGDTIDCYSREDGTVLATEANYTNVGIPIGVDFWMSIIHQRSTNITEFWLEDPETLLLSHTWAAINRDHPTIAIGVVNAPKTDNSWIDYVEVQDLT